MHFASQTVDGVVTYETVLSVDNSALLLRPGMTATADILVKYLEDVLLVPNAALRFTPPVMVEQTSSNGGLMRSLIPRPPNASKARDIVAASNQNEQQVWLLQDGQPTAISLSTGASNGIYTEITSGQIESGLTLIIDTISSEK